MVTEFTAAAQAVGSQVVRCTTLQQLEQQLAPGGQKLVLAGDFVAGYPRLAQKLINDGATVDGCALVAADADVGVTLAAAGLALTGTIVIASDDESVRWASTLPQRHIVLLPCADLYPSQRDVVDKLRDLLASPGAYVAYITGPSRTADIERVLTIGVHGPQQLTILLLDRELCEVRR